MKNGAVGDVTEIPLNTLVATAQDAPDDNTPAMNEIIRRFQANAHRIAERATEQTAIQDDAAQAALLALVRAVRKHDGRSAGFSSYASRYMVGAARREVVLWIKASSVASLDTNEGWEAASLVPAAAPVVGQLVWGHGRAAAIVGTMTPTLRAILDRRYIEDATLSDIARAVGTSVPAISQRLATAHRMVAARLAA